MVYKSEIDYQQKLSELEGVGEELLNFSETCNLTEVLEHYHILSDTAIDATRIAKNIVNQKKLLGEEKFNFLNEPFYIEDEIRDKIVRNIRKCENYMIK